MDIKSRNLPRLSKEQLYRLLAESSLSAADRELVKNELVKREADDLYNQATRTRGMEILPTVSGKPAGGPGAKKRFTIPPVAWLLLVFLLFVLAYALYTAFLR